jgi:hypothetical protein
MRNRTAYHDHGLVFAKEWVVVRKREETLGQPLQLNNLGQREYAKLIRKAGVRKFTTWAITLRFAPAQLIAMVSRAG